MALLQNAELAFNRLFNKKTDSGHDFCPYRWTDAGTLSYQEEDGGRPSG